jgi:ABC-2 type transport system ATP-binding protein
MRVVEVRNLKKIFKVHEKEAGLGGSIKSLFRRNYKFVNAVDDISFSIEQGELIGFIGQNGAGKTTTLKMLSGLLYPTKGDVTVLGYKPWERKNEFQKQFSLVMGQKNQLWWDLPPIETFNLNKEIYQIKDSVYKKTLNTLVELLEVQDILKIQVRKLSLGQRMKCELIAALLHNPKVLFLDEPTIGLDVVMQKTMRDFIKTYNRQFEATIILTSHYMEDVKQLCKRVVIIDHGKIYFDGLLQDVIDRFARNKILTVVFEEPVSRKALAAIGEVTEFESPQAKILVARKDTARKSIELLQKFKVDDINIEEPPIEAIIREVFMNHKAEHE